jgi:hypothetical protein
MKLSEEQETRLTNEMLDMLADARLCRRELRTVDIHRKLGGEISLGQIVQLLRESGRARASARRVYDHDVWSLTPDELLARVKGSDAT